MGSHYIRNVNDALEVVNHAKHKQEDVENITQVFYYPSEVECQSTLTDLRLIDVDESFIKTLEEGDGFVFRGAENEKLVLCSEDETFEVKEGEISNNLVLVPDLLFHSEVKTTHTETHTVCEKKIAGLLSSYLEFRPTFPRLSKLRKQLMTARYKGPEEEIEIEHKGYYVCELLETIQCSRNELLHELKDLAACCIDDKWRILDIEYETRVLSILINLAEVKSWTDIPKETCRRQLTDQIPSVIFEHIFTHFTESTGEGDLFRWRTKPLCRSFATMLLTAGEGKFRYNDFIMAWTQCLPQDMEPDLSSLRGLALTDYEGTQQQVIHMFPEYNLPENVPERFRLLFKRKEKWTLEEIQPYVEKLASKGINVSTMLTKHSRASTLNGARVFSARHVK